MTTSAVAPDDRDDTADEPLPADAAPVAAPTVTSEIMLLAQVQRGIATPPVIGVSRGMSVFGEHAAGWLALGMLGALVHRGRRQDWLVSTAGVAFKGLVEQRSLECDRHVADTTPHSN